MEIITFLILIELLPGSSLRYAESFSTVPPVSYLSPMWPPRHAQDLVRIIGGIDPLCSGTAEPFAPLTDLRKWRQLLGTLSQLLIEVDYRDLLLIVLKELIPVGETRGDLKHLLLWGISHNLSWDFVNLLLVGQLSQQSQVLRVSLRPDLHVFLRACVDRLLPAFREACKALHNTRSSIVQSMCLLTTSYQTTEMDIQVCGLLSSLLSDLQTDPCNIPYGRSTRAVRSLAVNCDYAGWKNSNKVSASDVSTCSESDKEAFIRSVCGDQDLLILLSSQEENNWLTGFCAYNTNPENMCHYISWINSPVSAFSVAYCWLVDQDQFVQFLCSNMNFLEELLQSPDNLWLDPTCGTDATITQTTPNALQQLCNYEQWQPTLIDPLSLAFCAENDMGDFSSFICHSPEVLLQLLNSDSSSWISNLCNSVNSDGLTLVKGCEYSSWLEITDTGQLRLTSWVNASVILTCSQFNEKLFAASVCNNVSLLLAVTVKTNHSWVRDVCSSHLSGLQDICNYSTWESQVPGQSTVGLCWVFYQEQLESYVCSNTAVLQKVNHSIPSGLKCTSNIIEPTTCSNLGNTAGFNTSVLLDCAVQDAVTFQQHICRNSTLLTQLISQVENSWVTTFCFSSNNLGISSNCPEWTSQFLTSSCPNCSTSDQQAMVRTICSDLNLIQSLSFLSNDTNRLTQVIVGRFCKYSSWNITCPPFYLMSYCWTFDPLNFYDFVCNHQDFFQDSSTDTSLRELLSSCNIDQKCHYVDWSPEGHTSADPININIVLLCSKEDSANFLASVCNNPSILSQITDVSAITWTLSFCYNVSSPAVLSQVLTWKICNYSQVSELSSSLVEFCWLYDREHFSTNICTNYSLHYLVKMRPEYSWIELVCFPPNCSLSQNNTIIQCQYEMWVSSQVDVSLLKFCATHDLDNFTNFFCHHTSDSTQINNTMLRFFCTMGHNVCSYQSWLESHVHPSVVKYCWGSDQSTFLSDVCGQSSLKASLFQDSTNSWLRLACGVLHMDSTEELVKVACRYEEWQTLETIPVHLKVLCLTYNRDEYLYNICRIQENNNCNNLVWDQDIVCEYNKWGNGNIDSGNLAMCWALDRTNFTAHVCAQPDLIYKLYSDPKTTWIVQVCFVTLIQGEPTPCISEADKKQLQWQCDTNLSTVCPTQGLTILDVLPLTLCARQVAGYSLDIHQITMLYAETVDLSVIFLLLLEEMEIVNISSSRMLKSTTLHLLIHLLSNDLFKNDEKKELLQTFGNTILQLTGEQASSESWRLIKEFLNLPLSNLTSITSQLSPDAAKSFLNILSKNWTIFQVTDEYLSALVSTILKVQVSAKPELFTDLIPVFSYLEPGEIIGLLHSMEDNKEVLQAIGGMFGSFSTDDRLALGIWLRGSLVFRNISNLSDEFIQQVQNLLPLLPLNVFHQLSPRQAMLILPSLPTDLSSSYQKIIASRVIQEPNITAEDVELMGTYVCQADVQDLAQRHWSAEAFLVLKRSLLHCIQNGDLYPNTKMLDFLLGGTSWQDPLSLSWQSLAGFSPLLPALGYTFLQSLHQEQLLPAVSEIGSVTLTPAQARELLHKIQSNGNVSHTALSSLGSLVLGFSPVTLQQLSTNQLLMLLPALSKHAESLSGAQVLAVLRTLWTAENITDRLVEIGPMLYSLPLIQLSKKRHEILYDLKKISGANWNMQQAQFLFREASKDQVLQGGITSLSNLLTGADCVSFLGFLKENVIQTMTLLRNISGMLPERLVSCALGHLALLPLTPELMNSLSSQIAVEIPHRRVALLSQQSCRNMLQTLQSKILSVTKLPWHRRQVLMDGLILCLGLAGVSTPQKQFVALRPLTPFLNGSIGLSVYQGILTQNVESITNYCYPPETQSLLTSLLQEPWMFGNPNQWEAQLLERMDRLIFLFPDLSLISVNKASLSSKWVLQLLFEDIKWKKSPAGAACLQSQSSEQRVARAARQRTLLRLSLPAQSSKRSKRTPPMPAPDCKTLRGSPASAWGADVLVRMTPVDFMDCLEDIGQNRDISSAELKSLLDRFLEINGPLAKSPPLQIARLGRLATKLRASQLRLIPLKDVQVMEALGREPEWTMSQMQVLVNGFMTSRSLTINDLDAVHLVTLGYAVCGLSSAAIEQLQPYEFCSAVLYLGSLSLTCTEQQLHAFTRLCTRREIFGPVSDWTEDILREMGSVAAGLQDIELSSLVVGQIQGLSPLAVSLMPPIKFAVSFSPTQLHMFSWSQALGVTDQQKRLLDNEQQKAVSVILAGDENGTQDYRAGISQAGHCSLSMAVGSCILFLCLHGINFL